MNILIPDNWLKTRLKTKAKPREIAKSLSLSSVSVERIEKIQDDYIYDVEVTTNRVDLMSIDGLARETAVVLKNFGIQAEFIEEKLPAVRQTGDNLIDIKSESGLVDRLLAVVLDVDMGKSPDYVTDRLEKTGIRSLNNVIDVTNYVMRQTGHPLHVFDFDRLDTKTLTIKKSKGGEKINTLDKKTHTLPGADIIAVDDSNRIVDLLSIMGLENSVVTDQTKRILLFVNTCDKNLIRKTSMALGIRTEAAVINEKGVDPELAETAFRMAVEMYQKIAKGKVISKITDIYESKPKQSTVKVSLDKINSVIGVNIDSKKSLEILNGLGFNSKLNGQYIESIVPSYRLEDVTIPEDLIEEIARIYGYHNLPNKLPPANHTDFYQIDKNPYYWQDRAKNALKYWGFVECYTYSMVSEKLYEGPTSDSVRLKNPLDEDHIFLRNSLVPSLLEVIEVNKNNDQIQIFEMSNIYIKNQNELPDHIKTLAGVIKKPNNSFYNVKGIVEQLLQDLGINEIKFSQSEEHLGSDVYIGKSLIGTIEELDDNLIDFELNFDSIIEHATNKKTYKQISKFPPIIEDLAIIVSEDINTQDVIKMIKNSDPLVEDVSLLDKYKDTRTFHIVYRDRERNLTGEDIRPVREKLVNKLESDLNVKVKN